MGAYIPYGLSGYIPKVLSADGCCDADRANRAGGDTATTAGAAGVVDQRKAGAAKLRAKAQGTRFATVLATTAHHTVGSQAALIDLGQLLPWWLFGLAQQRSRPTGLDAPATEGTTTTAEIDGSKATIAANDVFDAVVEQRARYREASLIVVECAEFRVCTDFRL